MDTEGIVRWMRRRAGPSTTLLQDTATATAFISSQDLVVVGFFKVGWREAGWGGGGGQLWAVATGTHEVAPQDLGSEAAQVFDEVASEVVDMPFGVAEAAELFQAYGLSADTICLFKKVRGQWGGWQGHPCSPPPPALTGPCPGSMTRDGQTSPWTRHGGWMRLSSPSCSVSTAWSW